MSGWISAEDRMPEKSGRYLVYTESGSCFDAGYDENIDDGCPFGEWVEQFDSYTLGSLGSDWTPYCEITHWMPLPDPPEGAQP